MSGDAPRKRRAASSERVGGQGSYTPLSLRVTGSDATVEGLKVIGDGMEMVHMMKGDIHRWIMSDRKMSKLKKREVIFKSFVSISFFFLIVQAESIKMLVAEAIYIYIHIIHVIEFILI